MEPSEIDQLITKWNPHFTNSAKGEWVGTVSRGKYLERLVKAMDWRHIVILTGVRRSGKSTLMRQLMGKIIGSGVDPKNVLYLYFEDLLVQKYLPLGGELLEQLYTFGDPGRDPRGRVITVAYFALVSAPLEISAGSDAKTAKWWSVNNLPKLAFDHKKIIDYALQRLRGNRNSSRECSALSRISNNYRRQ